MEIDFTKIKLVIWDLDDTFWIGTLSEGGCRAIDANLKIIQSLTDHGIINSICSKNDENEAEKELIKMGVSDLFVFKSINWQPKGERIARLIKTMGLRPVNVLFLDDNPQNISEATHYSNGLMASDPREILPSFTEWLEKTPAGDEAHKRLIQYKVLEEKENSKASYSSNEAFLYDCNLKVAIHTDWQNQLKRIAELVQRSNQLNFTKYRQTEDELRELCERDAINAGYVTVSDRFGDYGLVGFYAIDKTTNSCVHFLFSCRTIGQGVEQYVYARLGYPKLDVVGDVISMVDNGPAPSWINQEGILKKVVSPRLEKGNALKVLFKGPCDLQGTTKFLQGACEIDEEFTYVGVNGNLIESQNHSASIVGLLKYTEEEKKQLSVENCFMDKSFWVSNIFSKDYDLIFLSTLMESNIGLYKRNADSLVLPFGEGYFPLTDSSNWNGLIDGTIYNAQNHFDKNYLEWFAKNYTFIGITDADEYIKRLKFIINNVNKKAKVCLILGSEMPFLRNEQPAYQNRHLRHKEFNDKIKAFACNEPRLLLLDVNDFIKDQNDFNGNINHFTVSVYYKMAGRVIEIVNSLSGAESLMRKSWMSKAKESLKLSVKNFLSNKILYKKLFKF